MISYLAICSFSVYMLGAVGGVCVCVSTCVRIILVQCITLLRASAAAWNVRVMEFTRIANYLRVFRIT